MSGRRYVLFFAGEVQARTDRLPLVQGWLDSDDPRYTACDTQGCFDAPCTYCVQAGAPVDVQDAPLVPEAEYIGELYDFEVAMHENGSWTGADTLAPPPVHEELVTERVLILDGPSYLRPWRGARLEVGA